MVMVIITTKLFFNKALAIDFILITNSKYALNLKNITINEISDAIIVPKKIPKKPIK